MSEMVFLALERALQQGSCPVCRVVREGEEQRIWLLLYEQTGDPPLREVFNETLGFCHYHGHLATRIVYERELMAGSSVARMYETVVMRYRRTLQEISQAQGSPRPFRRGGILAKGLASRGRAIPLRGSPGPGGTGMGECMICVASQKALFAGVATLLRMLGHGEPRSAYTRSDGLCNPHFTLAISKAGREAKRFLMDEQERRMEGLQGRLFELQRKQSYDVDETVTPLEEQAWREAIWRFTGVHWDGLLVRRRV
ncbi:MAG TPA: DUF6062 family protein [Dehalococcoidia bacterium]|nr:DUF6062 family protein [Dehalococcoidia bacterium]HLB29580.1 DUF6062 family protein [Dehalococcoidia bacterium]